MQGQIRVRGQRVHFVHVPPEEVHQVVPLLVREKVPVVRVLVVAPGPPRAVHQRGHGLLQLLHVTGGPLGEVLLGVGHRISDLALLNQADKLPYPELELEL